MRWLWIAAGIATIVLVTFFASKVIADYAESATMTFDMTTRTGEILVKVDLSKNDLFKFTTNPHQKSIKIYDSAIRVIQLEQTKLRAVMTAEAEAERMRNPQPERPVFVGPD